MNGESRKAQLESWLDAFQIPDDVPKDLRGAVLPGDGRLAAADRITIRTLHALLVRSPVDAMVLVDECDEAHRTALAIDSRDEWLLDHGSIEIDDRLRRELAREFSGSLTITDLPKGPALGEIASWLSLLAPGVRILPIRRRRDIGGASEEGARLGRLLGEAKVAVVAASQLTQYGAAHKLIPAGVGPSGEKWLEENDSRLIQRIRALDAEGVLGDAAAQRSAENPNAIAIAIGSARPRDGWSGHVIEYTHTHRESAEPIFTDGIGMVGIVF